MKSANTLPERLLAEALRRRGLTFEQHVRGLPGTPDVAFGGDRVAVFVHGCYWHRHYNCGRARTPQTGTREWVGRFAANVDRDQQVMTKLRSDGWLVYIAWECDLLSDADHVAARVAQARAMQVVALAQGPASAGAAR